MVVCKTCDMISFLLLNRQEFPGRCTLTDHCRITVVWQKNTNNFWGDLQEGHWFFVFNMLWENSMFFFLLLLWYSWGQTDWWFLHTYTAKHWHLWAVALLKTAMNFKVVMHEFKIWWVKWGCGNQRHRDGNN